jgi:hypothetical protein
MKQGSERLAEVADRLAGYQVDDQHGEKIGKVDDLFVDDLNDRLEYISVMMDSFELRRTLIPIGALCVNDECQLVQIFQPKDKVDDAPYFNDYEDITAEFELRVLSYFGLGSAECTGERYASVAMGNADRGCL